MQYGVNISHQMEYLLATGNLVSRSGLGLMQVTDYYDFFVWPMKLLRTPHSPVFNGQDLTNARYLESRFNSDLYMHFFYLLLEANKPLNSGRAVAMFVKLKFKLISVLPFVWGCNFFFLFANDCYSWITSMDLFDSEFFPL